MEANLACFPIAGLLNEHPSSYAPMAADKGLALTVVAGTATVRNDLVLPGRMIRNLADNAVRYT